MSADVCRVSCVTAYLLQMHDKQAKKVHTSWKSKNRLSSQNISIFCELILRESRL
jgi:hypothetical protein